MMIMLMASDVSLFSVVGVREIWDIGFPKYQCLTYKKQVFCWRMKSMMVRGGCD